MTAGKKKHKSWTSTGSFPGTGTSSSSPRHPPRAERHPRLGRDVQPPVDGHPQPSLSSMQPFLLFFWAVFCQHLYSTSGLWQLWMAGGLLSRFLALSPLSFWVLSWQRVVHSVKQSFFICLHLVLYRGIWVAPETYLIFKLSVYVLLPRWTGVLDADWSVFSGEEKKLKGVLIQHECVYKSWVTYDLAVILLYTW